MAIFGAAFQIGRSALAAYQSALATTGQNVANVGNSDYTRQTARLAALPGGMTLGGVTPGTGVDVSSLQRHIDESIETRLRFAQADRNAAQTTHDTLSRIEDLYGDTTSYDLSSQLTALFNSFSNLQTDPADNTARDLVLTNAKAVISTLQRDRTGLLSEVSGLNSQVESAVRSANSMAAEIASLNEQIVAASARGTGGDSALRDRRDSLLRGLADLMDVQTREQSSGVVNVYVGSTPLVEFNRSRGLTTVTATDNGIERTQVRFADNQGPVTLRSGQIAALVDARDVQVDEQLTRLDQLAHGLVYEVNKVHAGGQGLVGQTDISGDFSVRDPDAALNSSDAGLDFPVQNGTFLLHLRDQTSGVTTTRMIQVDLDGLNGNDTSLVDLAKSIEANTGCSASISADGRLQLKAPPGQEITFSEDTSGVLAALGIGTFFAGSDVNSLSINSAVQSDPRLIATSLSGAAGDGTNAGRLAAVGASASSLLGGLSVEDFHAATTNQLAVNTAAAETAYDAADAVHSSLQAQREAVSGVNLDEETINLTMYERAFQGASRYLDVLNTLSDSVLSLVQ